MVHTGGARRLRLLITTFLAASLTLAAPPAIADDDEAPAGGQRVSKCSPTLSLSMVGNSTVRLSVSAKGIFGGDQDQPEPEPTDSASPSASPSETPSPSASPSATPSESASPEPSPTPSESATPEPSPTDTATNTSPRLSAMELFCLNYTVRLTAIDAESGEQLLDTKETRRFWILGTSWVQNIQVKPGTTVAAVATQGSYSARDRITAPDVPDVPRNFIAGEQTSDSILLQWTRPASDGGRRVLDYSVSWDGGRITTEGTTLLVSGLQAGTEYSFTLRARNEIGLSDAVLVTASTSRIPTNPSVVRELVASGPTKSSIALDWIAPADDGGSAIVGYEIQWTHDGKRYEDVVADSSYVANNLVPATKYTFSVRAVNAAGLSSAPVRVSKTTLLNPISRPDAPSVPTDVRIESVTRSTLAVTWNKPSSDGGSPVTGYIVTWSSASDKQSLVVDADQTTVVLPALTAGTEYTVTVQAKNQLGRSPAVTVTGRTAMKPVPTPTPPSAVQQLVVAWTGTDVVALTWEKPARSGGSPLEYYGVTDANDRLLATSTSGFAILNNLTPGTEYTFKVFAHNQMGNSTPVAIGVRTNMDPVPAPRAPSVPVNLTEYVQERNFILVGWEPPVDDGGDPVVGYHVTWGTGEELFTTQTWAYLVGLTPGTLYDVEVRAANITYQSDPAKLSVATQMDPVPTPQKPGAPVNVKITGSTGSSIAVDWEAPTTDGGAPIDGYLVQRTGGDEFFTTTTAALITGLAPSTDYTISVIAVNRARLTSPEVTVRARTAATPPTPQPAPQPFSPPVPGTNTDGSVNLDSSKVTIRQTSPGQWPVNTYVRSGRLKRIEAESGFLTNAGQEASLSVTYKSPSVARVVITLDPRTKAYYMRPILKPGKVSGSVILTVAAPATSVNGTRYEPLQASEKFIVRKRLVP